MSTMNFLALFVWFTVSAILKKQKPVNSLVVMPSILKEFISMSKIFQNNNNK